MNCITLWPRSVCLVSSGVWAAGVDSSGWDRVFACTCTGLGDVCISGLLGADRLPLPAVSDHSAHKDTTGSLDSACE